ncbi:MAG: lamin tail domain-containing protein [Candidatus Pacebacteria bacterium]|nr:lamin tail domain-containing protein [Candidatus Paceibacterota bacterium]
MPRTSVILHILITALVAVPFYVSAALVINEIMYDLPGSDSGREWVEIVNTGNESIDLSEWRFFEGGVNHLLKIIQGSSVISPEDYVIIADNPEKFKEDWPFYSKALFNSSFSLKNTGEPISLRNSDLIDESSVTYTNEWGGNGDGNSLQLINGEWEGGSPTPGENNVMEESFPPPQEDTVQEESPEPSTSPQSSPIVIKADVPQDIFVGREALFKGAANAGTTALIQDSYFLWTFGDGTATYGKETMHTYTQKGTYTIHLIVSFSEGTASKVFSVTVAPKIITQVTDAIPSEQETPIVIEPLVENVVVYKEDTDKKTPSQGKKIAYTEEEKSVNIAPVSTSSAAVSVAFAQTTKSVSYPIYFGFAVILLIPLGALAFLGKNKKNEADEYEILEN